MPPVVAVTLLPGAGGGVSEREERATAEIARAAAAGAEVVVLPEAWMPGYGPGPGDFGPRARAFALDRAAARRVHLALGFVDAGRSWIGFASPEGGWWAFAKRIPSPPERRWWRPGREVGRVETRLGRFGLALCGEALFPETWAAWTGRVDAVLIAAAWPDYVGRRGPLMRWVAARSPVERDRALSAGAAWLGVTAAFADAAGPWRGTEGFAGASCIVGPGGERALPEGGLALAELRRADPGPPFAVEGSWAAFLWAYRTLGTAGSAAGEGVARPGRVEGPGHGGV